LIFILFSVGLPNFNVRAATPTPTAQPTQQLESAACDATRSVQVSGVAVVNVTPDRALIKLGVQSNGNSAKEAQAKNSATINQVVKALKSQGIEAKDIATDWYTIEPLYEDYDSLRIKGYRIYNIVEVTMRDAGKSNEAMIAAFQAGANQVVDVQFYTSELRKYRDQARELAMKAATEKADALSSAAGSSVGCILTITENTQSNFYGGGWWGYGYGSNQNLMTQNVVQNVAPTGGESTTLDDGPLSAGQISVRAEVVASFGLK
jgi:hypothetical protein